MIERHIGKIAVRCRMMLLCAKKFCHNVIMCMLWNFSIAEVNRLESSLTLDASVRTPLQLLIATKTPIILRNQHTWGCPV